MDVIIALYWGINVLGRNSVKMESLHAMHERLGHGRVQSYIQSGNVVFSAKGLVNGITRKLAAEFAKEFGFAAQIVVVDAKRWGAMVEGDPFGQFAAESSVRRAEMKKGPDRMLIYLTIATRAWKSLLSRSWAN